MLRVTDIGSYLFRDYRVNAACDNVLSSVAHAYVGLRWSKYSTVHSRALHVLYCTHYCLRLWRVAVFCTVYVCTVWRINRVLLVWCHFPRWISRRQSSFCYYCADVLIVLAHLCSECSRARSATACVSHLSWLAMFTRPISCARSTVTVAATARPICRMLCTGA